MANEDAALPAVNANPAPAIVPPNNMSSFGPPPVMTQGMTYSEVGSSGLRAFGGYVREEFLPQLQGRQAMTVFREMSDNSPIIGGMLFAINASMRKVEWRVEPADDTPEAEEAAEFADSLRLDMSDTWEDTVASALSMLAYGFAPLELVYKRRDGMQTGMDPHRPGKRLPRSKYDDGKIGWRRLPIRGQDTIIKWFFDENGGVTGMTQQPWTGRIVDIPIEKLLLFRPSQHKGNPEGRSIIRNAYRPYYFVKRMEEQEAILAERLNGIPVIKVPGQLLERAQAGDPVAVQTLNNFKAIAINLRVDEQMGVVMPSDTFEGPTGPSSVSQYSLELVSPGGGTSGKGGSGAGSDAINRHQNGMMMSTLADFLMLGHGPNGTEALASEKKGMFFQAVESYLNSMAAVFNDHGLSRIWDLNGMDHDVMPNFVPDLATDVDLDILGNYINRLAASGMPLFPNEELESALLDAGGLPDIEDRDALAALYADGPMPLVGPAADKLSAELAPPPTPIIAGAPGQGGGADEEAGAPKSNFEKMVMASLARRVLRKGGTASIAKKRGRLPARRSPQVLFGKVG